MRKWVADFETTSEKRKEYDGTTFVWGVAMCEVGNPKNMKIMKSIEEFIEVCANKESNDLIFFHNLRFDGNFIVQWLLNNGYTFINDMSQRDSKTFTAIISDKSMWYQLEIYFAVKGNKVNKVTIQDSLKLVPLSVRDIAKSFKLPFQKGTIDYTAHDFLPEGSDLTEEEIDYITKDVQIVEHAVNFFHKKGLNKMTIGACALDEFKRMFNKKLFQKFFPPPFYDEQVRKAYRGGFTYLNPEFKDKEVDNLIVLDVNSLYPSVMAGCNGELMPYGAPVYFEGEYEEDKAFPLYIQKIRCSFDLKADKIPTIQIKNKHYYYGKGNEFMTTSDGEEVTLYLTSVDLELFFEQYDVYDPEYLGGWKFMAKSAKNIFGPYVEKWSDIKIAAKENNNWGMYLIAKLFLNNLYGKFASAVLVRNKVPYLDDDGKIRFKLGEGMQKDGIYIGMACFITAYARAKTIRAAQRITDDYAAGRSDIQFVYADTDSLHCVSPEFKLPEGLDIHPTKLGAWDHEASATRAKFLRQKCYMEKQIISESSYNEAMEDDDTIKEQYSKEGDCYYYTKITVAGMPDSCYKHVTFENFQAGATYPGKLSHRTVSGGVVLVDTNYTILD